MTDKLYPLHTGDKRRLADMGDGTHAEIVVAVPPDKLIAGGGINGVAPRIRTEPGEHSFFEKLQFRTFREFDTTAGTALAAGATYVIKAVVPVDLILLGLELTHGWRHTCGRHAP